MYDTSGSHSVCYASPPDYDVTARLNWLRGELARQERPRGPARGADEWRELRSVALGGALTTAEAYAWLGTLLGLFPPFAIFARIIGDAFWRGSGASGGLLYWGLFFLLMNAVCCLVGRQMGRFVWRRFGGAGSASVPGLLLRSVLMAVVWGVVTGAAGGALVFLVGAVVGAACALPVALGAFPVFAVLHRALSRDGMIEETRLWPVAFGVPLVAAALILSPWIK